MDVIMRFVSGAVFLLAASCKPGVIFLQDDPIDGPYRLRALANPAELHVCYLKTNGVCDLRIPGRVFAVAHDEDFVSAAVHPLNIPTEKLFYYIVRDFDGPRADTSRAVRGPFNESKFLKEMEAHGVPSPILLPPS
jgi:hypothetical protein